MFGCNVDIYERFWKMCCKVLIYRGFDGERIISLLDKFRTDIVSLSGGFILHCLTCTDDNLYYDGGDIDFYINSIEPEFFRTKTKDIFPNLPGIQEMILDNMTEYAHFGYKDMRYYNLDDNFMIQMVYLGTNGDTNFVDDFDFDFCKNIFNGKKLIVKNPFCVLDKSCVLLECNIQKVFIRQTTQHLVYGICDDVNRIRLDFRIEKYRKRGFTIILKEQENQYMSSDIISKRWKKWKNKTFFC